MAKRRTVSAAGNVLVPVARPVVINGGRTYDPDNPHSWLQLIGDPPGTHGERIMHGTLRLNRGDNPQRMSAAAFLAAKYRPVESPDPLAITALRHDVLTPRGVDDSYADPWLLGGLIDHGLARETAGTTPICCYWTVSDPDLAHLHEQWRRGRDVVAGLVDRFTVPMVLIQHAPERKLRHQAPHLHIVAACRTLGTRGFGAPVGDLIGDGARQVFVEAWRACSGRGGSACAAPPTKAGQLCLDDQDRKVEDGDSVPYAAKG